MPCDIVAVKGGQLGFTIFRTKRAIPPCVHQKTHDAMLTSACTKFTVRVTNPGITLVAWQHLANKRKQSQKNCLPGRGSPARGSNG
eukprot:1184891-Prorocentrum_minimum.AAC.3